MTTTSTSRYNVQSLSRGFIVVDNHHERGTVEVSLHHSLPIISIQHETHACGRTEHYHLYAFHAQLAHIADLLMWNWSPRLETQATDVLTKWAKAQTAKSLNHRVHAEWERLVNLVPEQQRQVQRALFSANFGIMAHAIDWQAYLEEIHPECWPELYEPEFAYLVKDLCRYRGLAQVFFNLHEYTRLLNTQPHPAGHPLAVLQYLCNAQRMFSQENHHRSILSHFQASWIDLFDPYNLQPVTRATRRSLHHVPVGLPAATLLRFQMQKDRPTKVLRHRLEWLLFVETYERQYFYPFYQKANVAEIREALRLYVEWISRECDRKRSYKSTGSVAGFVPFLEQYGQYRKYTHGLPKQSDLVTLTRQAIRYYERLESGEIEHEFDLID